MNRQRRFFHDMKRALQGGMSVQLAVAKLQGQVDAETFAKCQRLSRGRDWLSNSENENDKRYEASLRLYEEIADELASWGIPEKVALEIGKKNEFDVVFGGLVSPIGGEN